MTLELVIPGEIGAHTIISDGVADGSLVAGSDPSLVVDMLIGPLYFRRLLYHDHLDDTYVEALVQRTITPLLSTWRIDAQRDLR